MRRWRDLLEEFGMGKRKDTLGIEACDRTFHVPGSAYGPGGVRTDFPRLAGPPEARTTTPTMVPITPPEWSSFSPPLTGGYSPLDRGAGYSYQTDPESCAESCNPRGLLFPSKTGLILTSAPD